MPEIAFVNGKFLPLAEAVVSVEDRGFQFADGVYEVLASYGGRPFALEPHFQRLEHSLQALRIGLDIHAYGLEGIVREGIVRSGFAETLVYIQITRGTAPRHHEFPAGLIQPTVVMTVKELCRPAPELYQRGVKVVSTPDLRWKRCDIKSTSLLANILSKQQAVEAGAFEALLVDEEGRVTEGSSTSAFCVRQGVLSTAPAGPHILPSITRGVILNLAKALKLPVREEFATLEEYRQADEVFLAGTTTEAMPIVHLDEHPVADGKPGPLARRLREAFLEYVAHGDW
ncbi:MAG: D-amino acid aminotransferase [Candidatus Handelsmanbacteria bacterium]|nr:D-amino acid aminotransferase [Candidatus Handelsmanbacteria bacterium]